MILDKKNSTSTALLFVVVILLGVIGYLVFAEKQEPITQGSQTPTPTPTQIPTPASISAKPKIDLDAIFDLSKKAPGTKIYYSEKLGIGFTYFPADPDYVNVKDVVVESGNKISVGNQWVEVFKKDEKATLSDAITKELLTGIDPKDCFVKMEPKYNRLGGYLGAVIDYAYPSDPNDWWEAAAKCPEWYTPAGFVSYFLMNQDVPDKFIFLMVGQEPGISDGSIPEGSLEIPRGVKSGSDWRGSLKIIK